MKLKINLKELKKCRECGSKNLKRWIGYTLKPEKVILEDVNLIAKTKVKVINELKKELNKLFIEKRYFYDCKDCGGVSNTW